MKRNTLIPLILACCLLGGCAKPAVRVDLAAGTLEGYLDDGVEHYLGIPYAAPPVGELRWRSPQPAPTWSGVRSAASNPESCTQFVPLANSVTGSEDCLYVNVWTPAERPEAPLPVMVWIHGGGFTVGQGSYSNSDGLSLAARGNVVVVTLNYRLGVFGFLAHPQLDVEDPDHPGSGNYGIEDQTAALRWVRDNIAAFGGDPDNVTIFGQSAGGVSVCAQLASPAAAGLFHRAVIQSGPCGTPLSTVEATGVLGEQLAGEVQCDGTDDPLTCLRSRDTGDIARALPPDPGFAFGEGYTHWWPVLDGNVLPRQFMDAFESGEFNQVPVMNGATRDEATLLVWISHNFLFRPLEDEQYPQRLEYLLGNPKLAALTAERYPIENYGSAFDALSEAFSDGFFNCFARDQSLALARHVPTWSYQFDYDEAPFLIPWADLGAYHSAEIQYVFGKRLSIIGSDFSARDQALSDQMMDYWVRFARTGDPNGDGALPHWPAYDESDRTLLFDLDARVDTGVHREACEFWQGLPYLRPTYPAAS